MSTRYIVLRFEKGADGERSVEWELNENMDDPKRPSWGPKRYRTFKREKDAIRYAIKTHGSVLRVGVDPLTLEVSTRWVTTYEPL
ncbi:hypothetical protein SEA_DUNCANSLEG_82 [Mycobacterium phage DuncansLeg]|nr:hypothetical protein SEA_DUNCANSLEG_82 [Mycobacterium phage DuncansLeg]